MHTLGQSGKGAIEEPTINLTPLIDVVFVILIMFILIAPLLELDNVKLADAPSTPNDHTLSVQERSPIALHVRQDNTILLNQETVALANLTERLSELKQKYPQANPQLFQDKRAQFGTYQSVKNAAEAAGYNQMDIILNPMN